MRCLQIMSGCVSLAAATIVALPTASHAQGVLLLTEENSEIKTELNIMRDELGFTGCGVHTTFVVMPTLSYPAEGLSVALVLVVGGPKNDVLGGTVVKAMNTVAEAGTARPKQRNPTSMWIGKASAPKPMQVKLELSPSKDASMGIAEREAGMESILALAMSSESMQLSMSFAAKGNDRILQFVPPRLAPEEVRSFGACMTGLLARARAGEKSKSR